MGRLILAVTALAFTAGRQTPAGQPPAQSPVAGEHYQISVNVHLVVMHATVLDRQGHFATDLDEKAFDVYEDGVKQSIRLFRHEDVPVTVGLVIDHSGSMREKLDDVVAAARTFVASSSAEDQMFVVNFNDRVTFGLPESLPLTNRPDELARAISRTPAEGMTTLYDAVFTARTRLQTGAHDKKALIVISDGGDNASHHTAAEVLKMAGQSSALVYTIGIFDDSDDDKNPDVLRRLARATGGEAFFPGKQNEVVAICERIAKDIRHQYTIGYVSTNPAPATGFRSIRLTAHAAGKGKLSVRTRAGYAGGSK